MISATTRPLHDRIDTHRDDAPTTHGAAKAAVGALPALLTVAAGVLVLFCVGFLQTPAVHNAAHDTRHANGFPCH